MVAAITIVLVALLFFAGTVMALAVQSNLHTVGQIRNEDAVHYAAESAVARGIAASIQTRPPSTSLCGLPKPQINGVAISSKCDSVAVDRASADKVKQWAVPAPTLPASVELDLGGFDGSVVVWTVIGSRGNVNVSIGSCASSFPAGANYFFCPSINSKKVTLQIASAVRVEPFVIRAAQQGSKEFVVTVVGRAGNEAGQADVLLPKKGKPVLGLWGTVLP